MTYFNAQGQGRVGWRSLVVTQVVNAVDADAQAFISAAGITNLTQASAVNTLVNDLKTYGLWTKMKALYPMVGGTATTHKWNLKDPRDLDAAYRIFWAGGVTHSSNGVQFGGVNGYADTRLNANSSMSINDFHISVYSRTNTAVNTYEFGVGNTASERLGLGLSWDSQLPEASAFSSVKTTIPNSGNRTDKYFILNKTSSSSFDLFANTSKTTNTITTATKPNFNLWIGAFNYQNTGYYYTDKSIAFSSVGDGLTDTEAANFYNSVQKFQTTLGRQISDTDAQAFITAASITDSTQQYAINTLVTDLKVANIWTKMLAVYPFVGGTATTHKFNLKDPRDLNAAFRLRFNGGWAHTATGVLPNGTNAFAETFLSTRSVMGTSALDSLHLSFYSRTDVTSSGCDIGSGQNPVYFSSIHSKYNNAGTISTITSLSSSFVYIPNNAPSNAFYLVNRNSISQISLFRNSTKVSLTNLTRNYNSDMPFTISALNRGQGTTPNASDYSSRESAFTSVGYGLTDAESTAFYTAVQKYQTTLGRQV